MRNSVVKKINSSAIGVDIGGTGVKLGLVGPEGNILFRDSFPTHQSGAKKGLLEAVLRRLRDLMSMASARGLEMVGVGVGAPGAINVERGFVYFFPNIPGWKDTPLKSILERRLGVPVAVDNDANAMAYGEFCFGAGKGTKNLIALTLGTGIGGGLVIDGKLFHGPHFSAAELGHMILNEDGPLCACGNHGCIEAYVGNGYFVREVRRRLKKFPHSLLSRELRKGKELTPLLVAQTARRGDALSKEMWLETGTHLGNALVGLVNVLNPEKIILGGGIAQNGDLLFKPVITALNKKAFPIAAASVEVVPAALGVDAGVIGAAALAFRGSWERRK